MGVLPGVKAFVAAVLGGIGNIPGAAIGGLLIGIVETFVAGFVVLELPRRHRFRGADRDPAVPPRPACWANRRWKKSDAAPP